MFIDIIMKNKVIIATIEVVSLCMLIFGIYSITKSEYAAGILPIVLVAYINFALFINIRRKKIYTEHNILPLAVISPVIVSLILAVIFVLFIKELWIIYLIITFLALSILIFIIGFARNNKNKNH